MVRVEWISAVCGRWDLSSIDHGSSYLEFFREDIISLIGLFVKSVRMRPYRRAASLVQLAEADSHLVLKDREFLGSQ